MIVLKENQRLYLHSCNYNMARMMSALANLVKEHGGRVKPTRQALISDRNCKDAEPIKVTHINYLDVYAKQLSQLTNELLGMQDKYDVTADLDQIERLSSQLEQLKAVVDTLPLA